MPRYGIVRKREWRLQFKDDEAMTFTFASDETTLAAYPYDFVLCATYAVDGRCVTFLLDIKNRGITKIPFFVGAHPGFN